MVALPSPTRPVPPRMHVEPACHRIESPFLPDHRPVFQRPPVASEESRGDAIARCAVPDENAAGSQHARELVDRPLIVGGIIKESERREQVHDGVEPSPPARGQLLHVRDLVAERLAGAALLRSRDQIAAEVDAGDIESGFGEQMRMSPLPARNVEDPRSARKLEQLDEPADFTAVPLQIEERRILAQIPGVERARPPLLRARRLPAAGARRTPAQKKTGSR